VPPPRLLLFGPPRLALADGTTALLPRERRHQLLAWLALKGGWAGRAELAALLWPEHEGKLALANLRKALHRLQGTALAAALEVEGPSLRLAADTDVAAFENALAQGRLAEVAALGQGDLLEGYDDDTNEAWTTWLRDQRERLRGAWRHAALQTGAAAGPAPRAPTASARTSAGPAAPADDGFIGRGAELGRIAQLLAQPDCAMLALLGPGGIGKTSLARRALRELAPGYADGGVFVSLEEVSQPDEVAARAAAALGIALSGQAAPLEIVKSALGGKQLLLVLDNFEQLAADARWLHELSRACPRLDMLITSRTRPAASGVWTMPLDGLPCPEAEDEDRLEAFDAVQLFVRAARRVEPAFGAAHEAAAIVDICRQVAGLPLALELAASFTRVLSCAAIAAELREGTELLRAADPARPARQASLEVVFEQSWRLLTGAERQLLARLSIFRGGFTPAAARQVAGASLPMLAALVDKSLLRRDVDSAAGSRCHLHPLVQQLAFTKLTAGDAASRANEASATAAAHARHYLRLLADAGEALALARREAMREVEAEFDNLRAAWRYAAAQGPADDLARSAAALADYCDHRGRWREGAALLHEALAGAAVAADTCAQAPVAVAAALLVHRLDRYPEAIALAERALADARTPGDAASELQALRVLAITHVRLGRWDQARAEHRRVLQLAERAGDARHIAGTLANLSLLEHIAGHTDEALRLSMQALERHRAMADVRGEALALNNQGMMRIARGEMAIAREVLTAGRRLAEQHDLPAMLGLVESNLADVALAEGDLDAVLAHAERSREASLRCGQRATVAEAHLLRMQVALRRGELAAARSELAAAAELVLALERPGMKASVVHHFAVLLAAEGERGVAARVMAFLLAQPAATGATRRDGEAQLLAWGGSPGAPWPGPPLDELLQRVASEASSAYAPLLGQLRPAKLDA
jgi:predicted ATPase